MAGTPSPAPKGLYRRGVEKGWPGVRPRRRGRRRRRRATRATGIKGNGHHRDAIDKFKSAAELRRANSISHVVEELREKIAHVTETEEDAKRASDEPGLRIGRYPLRLFKDTQVAIAEVFALDDDRRRRGRNHELARTTSQLQDGKSAGNGDWDGFDRAGAGELLYTEFVLKLEAALAKDEDANDPWVR